MLFMPWQRVRETTPWSDLEVISNAMESCFRPGASPLGNGWLPALDVKESPEAIVVKADLPGMSKDHIRVTLKEDTLTLEGEKVTHEKGEQEGFVYRERASGKFSRVLTLPAAVDGHAIQAAYTNGVLEITLPKREEAKPRVVDVQIN